MKWPIRIILIGVLIYLLLGLLIYFFQHKLLFPATSLPDSHVFTSQYHFEEIDLKAPDGARINCVHYQLEKPRGLIVYYHGNGRTIERWMDVVEYFVAKDFDVFLMDYRQYGKSTGTLDEGKMIEDALMVYDYAIKNYAEEKVILYGRSMGTSFASQVAADRNPSLMILESPFKSIVDMGNRLFPIYPAELISRFPLRSDLVAKKIKCPVHIIHGTKDRTVPYDSGKQLHECYEASQASFYTLEGAGHNDVAQYDLYHQVIRKILSSY